MESVCIYVAQTVSLHQLTLDHLRDGFYLVKNNIILVAGNMLFAITMALTILLQHNWAGLLTTDGVVRWLE